MGKVTRKELPKDHPIFKGWSLGTIKKPLNKKSQKEPKKNQA